MVADEVRALAKRTQESTEEIQQIIKALQDGASSAAQAMLQSTSKTRDSVAQAENAGRTMSDISGAIGLIRDMTHQIAAAAQEQSHAADEINRNVVNMASLAENAPQPRPQNRLCHPWSWTKPPKTYRPWWRAFGYRLLRPSLKAPQGNELLCARRAD